MHSFRPVAEAEVVLAFLRGELGFAGGSQRRLTVRGYLGVSATTDRWSCY